MSGQLRTFKAAPAGPTNEELVAEAVERVKAHVDIDALEERVIKAAVTKALEQKHMIRSGGLWQGATLGVGAGILIAWLFMSGITQTLTRASAEAVGFGAVMGSAERDQKELKDIAP